MGLPGVRRVEYAGAPPGVLDVDERFFRGKGARFKMAAQPVESRRGVRRIDENDVERTAR